jgi:putative tryptophan/tyrosine transport system substrate-binding protein
MTIRWASLVSLVSVLSFATATGILASEAQESRKVARVVWFDVLVAGPPPPQWQESFRRGLRALGWIEGSNLRLDYRYAQRNDDAQAVAAEVMQSKPDVIVAPTTGAFRLRPSGIAPVRDIPIVFVSVSDPVAAGMAVTLARPGGNMTGLSYLGVELNAKRLELLKEAVPQAARVGVLVPGGHPLRDRMVKDVASAAQALNVQLHLAELSEPEATPERIDRLFESFAQARVDAVLGLQGPQYYRNRDRVVERSLRHRLPGIFELTEFADAGAFMAYAPNVPELYRRAATYVDKILRGARPGEMPVEQPTKFELVINMKTAKALGVSIPPALLLRADRVIE